MIFWKQNVRMQFQKRMSAKELAPRARFELATLRLTAERPTSSELAGVGTNRRKSANCDETRRIIFSFFIHHSFAYSRHSPPLVLRFYDGARVVGKFPRSPFLASDRHLYDLRAARLKLSRVDPIGLQFWGLYQGLHNDTILFRLFLQAAQLLRGCLRRINIEP